MKKILAVLVMLMSVLMVSNVSYAKSDGLISKQKYSYKDMKSDIKKLAKKYPDICDYDVIGKTSGKRNIYDVIIGDPFAEKSILVVNTLHAREYVCTVNSMNQIRYYLENYNKCINGVKPCYIFNKVQVHFITMANPDGVEISQNKNARWKANGKGVDLNRNYPYGFVKRGRPGSEEYTGISGGSEKETQAIMKVVQKLKENTKLCAVINYHAMGQIIFGGYSGKHKKVGRDIDKMYSLTRKLTGYRSAAGYPSTGGGNFREWVVYKMGIPSITIEVGNTECPCRSSEYKSIFEKNKRVVLEIARLYK